MKHFVILLVLYISASPCLAQTDIYFDALTESGKLYNLGVKAFESKNYGLADSLFSESLIMLPHKDTYFNKAIVKKYLKDEKGFAENLLLAAEYGDTAARRLFYRNCLITDTLLLTSDGKPALILNYDHILISRKGKNLEYEELEKRDKGNNIIFRYSVSNGDTVYHDGRVIANGMDISFRELLIHVRKNLKYPTFERDNHIQGTVFIAFLLTKQGNIEKVSILRSPGTGLSAAALRIFKDPIRLTPLHVNGNPINAFLVFPVKFTLK